ncbi:hypothetical protein ACP4OV_020192 [Aristida adscensionis]
MGWGGEAAAALVVAAAAARGRHRRRGGRPRARGRRRRRVRHHRRAHRRRRHAGHRCRRTVLSAHDTREASESRFAGELDARAAVECCNSAMAAGARGAGSAPAGGFPRAPRCASRACSAGLSPPLRAPWIGGGRSGLAVGLQSSQYPEKVERDFGWFKGIGFSHSVGDALSTT